MISRRLVLAATALAPVGVLVGCNSAPPLPTLASDAGLVLAGAQALEAAISGVANVPAATQQTIAGYFSTIQNAAAAVANGTKSDSATVSEVVDAIKAVVPIVLPLLPNGSALVPLANALLSMVPALLAYIGVGGAAAGMAGVYTPDQARLILRAAH